MGGVFFSHCFVKTIKGGELKKTKVGMGEKARERIEGRVSVKENGRETEREIEGERNSGRV